MIANPAAGVSVVPGSASATVNDPVNGNPSSDPRSYGTFANGVTAPGTLLPALNQNAMGDAAYSGGIGIASGVCLCTGRLTDGVSVPAQGVGVQGPNNGNGVNDDGTATNGAATHEPRNDPNPYRRLLGTCSFNEGEISTVVFAPTGDPELDVAKDRDFVQAIFSSNDPGGGDATVLEFDVTTSTPGFLQAKFVFGSDEAPFFLNQEFNDSVAILVDGENIATITDAQGMKPFTLQDIEECPQLYKKNDIAPAPAALNGSDHGQPGQPFYDHEFGGFTSVLTRETCYVLAPGTHTVKIVIQDVADRRLDSALFIPANSLKLYSFLQGDFDLDGDVSGLDFLRWQQNYGETNATFTQGDANNDHIVNSSDLPLLFANMGQTGGHKNLCADFNRDGSIDGLDFLIWQQHAGMEHCASRFEGDADGDGDVDTDDREIWDAEYDTQVSAGVCGCVGGAQMLMGGGGQIALLPEEEQALASTAEPGDTDNDGDFDEADMQYWLTYYGVVQ